MPGTCDADSRRGTNGSWWDRIHSTRATALAPRGEEPGIACPSGFGVPPNRAQAAARRRADLSTGREREIERDQHRRQQEEPDRVEPVKR